MWTDSGENRDRRQFRPRQGRDAFLKAVAGELDKSTDEVQKALRDIHRDRLSAKLAEAVEQGRLTQKQADYLGVPVEGPYKPEHYRS